MMKSNRVAITIVAFSIIVALGGLVLFIPQNAYAEGGGRGALTLKRVPLSDGLGSGSLGRQALLITPTLPPRDELPVRETPEATAGKSTSAKTKKKSAISGQVWDLFNDRPAANATVVINGNKYSTDGNGFYVVDGLPAGQYHVSIDLPEGAMSDYGEATVTIGTGETFPLDLSFYSQPISTSEGTSVAASNSDLDATANAGAAIAGSSSIARSEQNSEGNSPLTVYTGKDAAIWINPVFINHEMGEVGRIKVDVTNMSDFGGFQGQLTFDPDMVQIEMVRLGNFMESSGRAATPLLIDIDNKTGQAVFGAYSAGKDAGPNGGGTLLLINFTTTKEGRSDFELDNVILTSRLGNKIEAEMMAGTLSTSACFGDFNDDKVIDINDIQAVAGRMGQSQGDFNYTEVYDLNFDNQINDDDLAMLTARWNQTCTQ